MKFLLDTDHISILQKQSGAEFAALMATHRSGPACRSGLLHRQFPRASPRLQCLYRSSQDSRPISVRGYQMFDRVLSAFAAALVLPFDDKASVVFDGLVGNASGSRRWICGSHPLR